MTTAPSSPPTMTPRRAATAALLGSALEYYDFFVYGAAAALVFNVLFFPSGNPAVALIASFATFAVGYVARPVGAVVMGHFGDRLGRKRVMLATVVMMGVASFAIGCLPTYEQVGLFAPVLLVALRVVQGFSAGSESAGASTLTVEHSPVGRRGFFTSFVMVGYAVGCSLATVVFLPVAMLPHDALYTWGWRIPFWLSAVVVVITYYVRSHLDETPAFTEAKEGSRVRKRPLNDVIKHHWRDVIRVAGASLMASMQTLFAVFSLSYATSVGVDRGAMLAIISGAIALSIFGIPAVGYLSDVIGRKRTMLIGAAGCALTVFAYLWSISITNVLLIAIFAFVNMSLFFSCYNGVWTSFFAEQFPAPVRFTGMAVSNQIGNLLAGFAPLIAALLLGSGPSGWLPVAMFGAIATGIAALAVIGMRETSNTPAELLGGPRSAETLDRSHSEDRERSAAATTI
ncbi:putative MFS family arabinose efflux permease [Rhodococcus wratislaviensis]|uniref:Putative proline/betaine transporter n=1 Tax=Rhodococcus wratislaviensis TaxID=44752 RepID=A0AB38FCU7_RHOWR|nr:MFS transporter [Rhodococcus wratislaviensis]REE75644.1 putative MFS family arabinose efflux permease [Rhodococcus wratislaviensis]SPZ39319.1 MFS transporter [Rhodococcus wratislaviensis]